MSDVYIDMCIEAVKRPPPVEAWPVQHMVAAL